MISEEDLALLSAFEDGELDGAQRSELQQRLLREPDLRSELESLRATDESLRDFARQIDTSPLPESIAGLVRVAPGRSAVKLFAAAAAVFVVTIGSYLLMPRSAEIDYAQLSVLESGQRLAFGDSYLEVVASFQRLDGQYCRELMTRDSHEIACLLGASWQPVIAVSRQDVPVDAYQPAGTDLALIDGYVRQHIDGAVMTAREEHSLIKSGWQHP